MALRIDPTAPLGDDIRRNASELGAEIAGHLDPGAADPAAGFHAARKGLKRLRALLRLVRSAAPGDLAAIEHVCRDAARAIAERREAAAMVETLDRFIAEFPDRIVSARLGEIRAHLLRAAENGHDAVAAAATARALCENAGERLALLDLSQAAVEDLARGMEHCLGRWKKALRAACERGEPDDFHDLRKAVKAHGAQLALMRDFPLPHGKDRRARVDALGDLLGDLNDIHVMRAALRAGLPALPSDLDTRPFDRLLKRKAKALAAAILPEAEDLFDDAPDRLRRRLRKATRAAEPA